MMDRATFTNLLVNYTDSENIDQLNQAFDVFDKYNLEYVEMFDGFVGDAEGMPDDDFMVTVNDITRSTLRGLCIQHGLEPSDDILMSELTQICDGLFSALDYDDKPRMLDILRQDYNSSEKIAEILSLVTTLAPEQILSKIIRCEESLIERILEELTDDADPEEQSVAEHITSEEFQKCVQKLIAFKAYTQNAPCFIDQFIHNPATMALYFDVYFSIYLRDIVSKMNPIDAGIVAMDLIAMSCISTDANASPQEFLKNYIAKVTNDVAIQTNIGVNLTKFLGGIFRA